MRAPRLLAAIALALSALSAAACSSVPGGSGDNGLTTINVGVSPAAGTSTPMYLAVAQGVFRKLGLDVRLEPSTDGAVVVPRLMNGQLQFCMSSFGPFVSAADKNLPIKMIAPVNRQQSDGHYTAIIVPSGSKATDMSQVHVFAQQEGQPDPLSQLTVTRLNGDYKAMRLLAVPLGSIADAVGGGSADAGRLFQPFLAQALAKGKVRVLSYITADVTLPGVPSAVFLGNQSYLAAHADVAKRFTEGVREANVYARDHLPEVGAYAAKTPLNSGAIPGDDLPDFDPNGVNVALVQELLDLYDKEGYLTKPLDAKTVTWVAGAS